MRHLTVPRVSCLQCEQNWKFNAAAVTEMFWCFYDGQRPGEVPALSHSSAVLLWWGQCTHSLQRPWSAGMPVLPLRHSMAPGVLAFIHVINSVEPCLKAPLASLCPQARADLLSLSVVNTATSQQLLIFALAHPQGSFSVGLEVETVSTSAPTHPAHTQHCFYTLNMSGHWF